MPPISQVYNYKSPAFLSEDTHSITQEGTKNLTSILAQNFQNCNVIRESLLEAEKEGPMVFHVVATV